MTRQGCDALRSVLTATSGSSSCSESVHWATSALVGTSTTALMPAAAASLTAAMPMRVLPAPVTDSTTPVRSASRHAVSASTCHGRRGTGASLSEP